MIDLKPGAGPHNSNGPIHGYFGLTRASYLVVPRLALQELPLAWQERFVALLWEASDKFGLNTPDNYVVSRRRANGQFIPDDPWRRYRHGSVERAIAEDKERGL